MSKYSRRRRPRQIFLGNFYLNPSVQYLTTVISAIALAGFVFSGFLLFRFTDEEDLINRGKTQLMEGKVAWAAKTFQTLVSHHRDSYEGHLLLGQAYLQLDERRKAEQEFEIAASLKRKTTKDAAPEIAMSKVAMAQNDFKRAENILTKAWRKSRKDLELKQALFELYEHWGNTLYDVEGKDYAQIIQKYQTALYYVNDYQAQQIIEQRMVECIQAYTERLIAMREYETAIQQLKVSLRYKYLPDTLVQIAETYNRMNRLDDSITWFRKAFDVSPNVVGLRLINALLEKGQQLTKAKQPDEAQAYFDEADKISKDAKVALDMLYPVTISSVNINNDMDEATGEFEPTITVNLANDSTRDLNFLAVKAEFVSGSTTLATATERIATPDKPLPSRILKTWRPVNRVSLKLKPDGKLNVHALQEGKLTVKISIAYQDGDEAVWKLKSIQEATISTGTLRPVLEAKPV